MISYDGGMQRTIARGDLLGAAETLTALTTAGAGALTGAILNSNIINRTGPGGAVADTLDTAPAIIAAIGTVNHGDSWRIRYINTVAFAITWTGVTGVTVTNGIVNASSVKDFLMTIVNATAQSIAACSLTNTSAIVTGMTAAQTAAISPGQLVTGTGITGGTTVLSVQPGIGFTLSANATATGSLVAVTFNPVVTCVGLGQGLL